jgi:hypothetical protein
VRRTGRSTSRPYVWVLNIDGDIGGGPINDPFGVGIISLLEHLEGMVMIDLNLRYKRVGIIADGMWADVRASGFHNGPAGGLANWQLDLGMAFGTGGVFYRFRPKEGLSVDPYIAARWWRMHPTLTVIDLGGFNLPPFNGGGVVTWADPVFGLKFNYDITEKWRFKGAADVGGGVSKVSWQVIVGGGYQLTPHFGFELLYRVMGVDYQPNGTKIELKLNGVVVGLNFHY